MKSYEEAVATVPAEAAVLRRRASLAAIRAGRLVAQAEAIERAHIQAERPVGCESCRHAVVKHGRLTNRGWGAPCASCAVVGRSNWEPMP